MIKIVMTFLSLFLMAFNSYALTISNNDELRAYLIKKKFSGVILAAEKDRILFYESFGFRDLKKQDKIKRDDIFQVGSNTKAMVAMALLKWQEDGLLNISNPISDYVKAPGAYHLIRVKDLLNHTSGMINYTQKKKFWESVQPDKKTSLQDIMNFITDYPLIFDPQSRFHYTNSNYIFAGKILENVGHASWKTQLKNMIFKPLQMANTGHVDRFEDISPVKGHIRISSDVYQAFEGFDLSWVQTAGSVYSTAEDMLKWLRNYSNNKIINAESHKMMITPFKNGYGLGVHVQKKDGDIHIWHNGHTPGFYSTTSHFVSRNLSIISLDNKDGSVNNLRATLTDFFVNGSAEVVEDDEKAIAINI